MGLLVEWAEFFVKALDEIGDFLLYRPFKDLPIGNAFFGNAFWNDSYEEMIERWQSITNLSIASIILGTTLTGILIYKIVKFILDIIF